jgi:Aldehyde dehydrogenase family
MFVAPTLIDEIDNNSRVAQEEIFGPVAALMPFSDLDDVVRQGNDTIYGLAASVWTRDLATAHLAPTGLTPAPSGSTGPASRAPDPCPSAASNNPGSDVSTAGRCSTPTPRSRASSSSSTRDDDADGRNPVHVRSVPQSLPVPQAGRARLQRRRSPIATETPGGDLCEMRGQSRLVAMTMRSGRRSAAVVRAVRSQA